MDGSCKATCPSEAVACGDRCVDLESDPKNCGACGSACGLAEVCSRGQCVSACDEGLTACGAGCFDLTSNPKRCGGCWNECPVPANSAPLCREGNCSFTCQTGWGDCDGDPATGCEHDLREDPANCGACGKACPADTDCLEGACCPEGHRNCGGSCVDVGNDPTHCGSCGRACQEDEVCWEGACRPCRPGSGACDGNTLLICKADGSGWDRVPCDLELGLVCNAEEGLCDGPCAPERLGPHDLGCEFFPTTLPTESPRYDDSFGIAIANPGPEPAEIRIAGGELSEAIAFTLAPGETDLLALPWVPALIPCPETHCTSGAYLVREGAYRVKASRPVAVHQFSPISGEHPTRDSSLLLPKNSLGQHYYVLAWANLGNRFPGVITIVATEDQTEVELTPTVAAAGQNGAPDFSAGETTRVLLQQGDALQLLAETGDPSGSEVRASRPVQVFGAHSCAEVPSGRQFCDHLEESMLPVDLAGTSYLSASPAATRRPRVVRVLATEDETSLTYDPPQPDLPTYLEKAGEFLTFETSETFVLESDRPVLVAEYMTGGSAGPGDPSITLALPRHRFRNHHLIHTPEGGQNLVQIYAPAGAAVFLDEVELDGFAPIGNSDYGVLEVALTPGTHYIHASAPVGIQLFGLGISNSYWHPGG